KPLTEHLGAELDERRDLAGPLDAVDLARSVYAARALVERTLMELQALGEAELVARNCLNQLEADPRGWRAGGSGLHARRECIQNEQRGTGGDAAPFPHTGTMLPPHPSQPALAAESPCLRCFGSLPSRPQPLTVPHARSNEHGLIG